MPDHNYFSNLIWQIADLLRGPYRPPQYERVMLPMTVLRRFDCVLAPTKAKVLAEYERRKGGKLEGDALDTNLNKAAGQRFHNHSPLDFEKLKGDPDNIEKHVVSYIKGFSKNVRDIFDFFEFESEIERMREANLLYLVVSKFCDVDLHPERVPNEQMGLIFENLIRRFIELSVKCVTLEPPALTSGVLGQDLGLRRGEHAVEPAQHGHRQHDALVLRRAVRAAQ